MSGATMHIDVHHVTRVEGHGNIVVDLLNGAVKKIEWQVPEAPRFFEAMVVGRHFSEVATITSRICGICSIGHTFASLKATEAALGVTISEQSRLLREILTHGENLQSHVLHICYLVLPDLLKVNSVLPLIATHREAVLLVTRLHRLANELCDCVGGRTTHPVRAVVGGWTMLPKPAELEAFRSRLADSKKEIAALAGLVRSLAGGLPDFTRETEYICLADPKEYALYDGQIKSSDVKEPIPVADYRRVTNEFIVPTSTAKWAKFNRDAYFAGALARFNNNFDLLTPGAKALAASFGLAAPNHNPYMNTIAQIVEVMHSTDRCIDHLTRLLDTGLKDEPIKVSPRAGRGAGSVDVPRGILFHDYTYDTNGICTAANCIIPTNQNHANIQKDMEKLVPEHKNDGRERLQFLLEMLVRAYDPCISCSTHYLKVCFV